MPMHLQMSESLVQKITQFYGMEQKKRVNAPEAPNDCIGWAEER